MPKIGLRQRELLSGGSIFVLSACALALAGPAAAQDAGTTTEVVVTAQRQSLQNAQEIKRNSDQIVDSITATDIGALPDRSVTEALQRLPGVTIGHTTDPRDADRLTVEGSGVQIRGLSWVRSELNGRDSFSAKNGRGLSFEDVPPELMAGVDVYKNPGADIIEGGVGGTVNLRTRMPFDAPGRVFAFSLDEEYGDMRKVDKPTGSVLYSNRWQTGIGEIGILADFTLSKLASREDTISVDPYFVRTDLVPGQTVFVPGGFGYRRLDLDRKRMGEAFALQWRPNDQWEASFQYLRSQASLASAEHAVGFDPGSGNGPAAGAPPFVYSSQGFFEKGTLAGSPGGTGLGSSVLDARYDRRNSVTTDYSLHAKFTPNDKWQFSGDVQYVRAKTKTFDFTAFNSLGANASPATLDLTGSHPVITMNNDPTYFSNPANYYLLAAMDYHDYNTAGEWAERLDGTYSFDEGSWLKRVRFGVRNTYRSTTIRETTFNWNTVAPSWSAPAISQISALNGYEEIFSFKDYFRGDVHLPATFIQPTTSLVNPYAKGAAILSGIAAQYGGGWRAFNGDFSKSNPSVGGDVNYEKEKTLAGYVVADFDHDVPLFGDSREIDGNVGVRVVRTEPSAIGHQQFVFPGQGTDLPPADVAFLNGATSDFTGGREYTSVLPSFNARLKITPELFLRVAAAKSIVRPDFNQLQPFFNISGTVGYLTNGVCNSGVPTGLKGNCVFQYTATGGNPNLKPIRANSYDVTLEWYFSKVGSLTVDAFYKDVFNFITNGLVSKSFTNNGQTRTALLNQPYNAGHGTIKGVEVAYQQYYDFLPGALKGLGLQANFTYIDSKGARNAAVNPFDTGQTSNLATAGSSLPLEGLSRRAYNIAGLYDYGPFSARVAYNWRERYLLTTTAANINIPAWFDDYGELDASLFYTLNEHVKLGVQGSNLANAESKILVSYPSRPDEGLTTHNWVQTDRRYSVVLRATF